MVEGSLVDCELEQRSHSAIRQEIVQNHKGAKEEENGAGKLQSKSVRRRSLNSIEFEGRRNSQREGREKVL